jgi:CBS-domain-containing membrane protein
MTVTVEAAPTSQPAGGGGSLAPVSRLTVPRMLAVGSVVSSATAFRVGLGWGELLLTRTPPLARLALMAALGGPEAGTAEATFRDDLLALARDSAAASWRELRRGVDDLDRLTRTDATRPGERPHRPYRIKV